MGEVEAARQRARSEGCSRIRGRPVPLERQARKSLLCDQWLMDSRGDPVVPLCRRHRLCSSAAPVPDRLAPSGGGPCDASREPALRSRAVPGCFCARFRVDRDANESQDRLGGESRDFGARSRRQGDPVEDHRPQYLVDGERLLPSDAAWQRALERVTLAALCRFACVAPTASRCTSRATSSSWSSACPTPAISTIPSARRTKRRRASRASARCSAKQSSSARRIASKCGSISR